uniref:AIG1-type G domain-containing protein n=1 Tax=Xiphophorus couchianus TaxID=32473 RepID=A0A3B5MKP1_9TELE
IEMATGSNWFPVSDLVHLTCRSVGSGVNTFLPTFSGPAETSSDGTDRVTGSDGPDGSDGFAGSALLRDRRIVLIGPAGSGKSSAGNTLLGFRHFEPDSDFAGVRSDPERCSAEVGRVQLTVVDSAGLSEEVLTLNRLVMELRTWMYLAEPDPHVLVLVLKIGRLSYGSTQLLRLLTRLLDQNQNLARHAAVLFTHGDALGGRNLTDQVQASSCVSDLLTRCGGRHAVLDNTQNQDQVQVDRFLRLLDQMVQENSGRFLSPADWNRPPGPGQTFWSRLRGSGLWIWGRLAHTQSQVCVCVWGGVCLAAFCSKCISQ